MPETSAIQDARPAQRGNNIVLIGMPGVGKSSTGVVLAKMLNYDFIDVDILIQKKFGRTLQEMIDGEGGEEFIRKEGEVLDEIHCERTVISTGGSAVYSEAAMEKLAAESNVIYLQVRLEELRHRLPGFDNRGVVMRDPSITTLDGLYAERIPLYERFAHHTVDTDGLSISEVAQRLATLAQNNIDRDLTDRS